MLNVRCVDMSALVHVHGNDSLDIVLDVKRSLNPGRRRVKATFGVVRLCKPFPVLMMRSDVYITITWTAAVTNSLPLPR